MCTAGGRGDDGQPCADVGNLADTVPLLFFVLTNRTVQAPKMGKMVFDMDKGKINFYLGSLHLQPLKMSKKTFLPGTGSKKVDYIFSVQNVESFGIFHDLFQIKTILISEGLFVFILGAEK